MICPRCKRPVSDSANFCGSCGLPRAEIERYYREQEILRTSDASAPSETEDLAERLQRTLDEDNYIINSGTDIPRENTSFEERNRDYLIQFTDGSADTAGEELRSDPEPGEPEYSEPLPDPRETVNGQSAFSAAAPRYPEYAEPYYRQEAVPESEPVRDQNLSTVDYVWMLIISAVPVIGILYLIYLGFIQKENVNRKSFGRAMLIVIVFTIILFCVFIAGVISTLGRIYYGGRYF